MNERAKEVRAEGHTDVLHCSQRTSCGNNLTIQKSNDQTIERRLSDPQS